MPLHRSLLQLTTAVLLASTPGLADNASAEGSPAVVAVSSQQRGSLPVTFELLRTTLDTEQLRAALETELGVRVAETSELDGVGLAVRVERHRARVRFTTERGETIERRVDLSSDDERSAEIIALLAGNLARDQASELLTRLEPAEAPPSEVPPATEGSADVGAAPPPPAPPPKTNKPARASAPPSKSRERTRTPEQLPTGFINLSLWHPVALHRDSERWRFKLELGAAYGLVGAVDGFALTLGYSRIERDLAGAVMTLGWARVDGEVRGAQIGGLFTEGHGRLRGYEAANIATLRWGDVEGAQTAAGFALARDVIGFQGAAAVAVARDVRGAQAAVIALGRDVAGAQASIIGVARDVEGVQLGVVNVARRVDLQLGIVNVAEHVDGAAIGLVSIAGNGRVQPTIWSVYDADWAVNGGVRFVAGMAYSELAIGTYGTDWALRSEAGGGFYWGGQRAALQLGVHASQRYEPEGNAVEQHRLHYRATASYRIAPPLSLGAGFDLNHDVVNFGEDLQPSPLVMLSLF